MNAFDWLVAPSGFWEQALPNLFATFVGVLLGIPAALFLERLRAGRERSARQRTVLTAYQDAVDTNLQVIEHILKWLIPEMGATPIASFSVDLGSFQTVSQWALEVMDDLPLLQKLNEFQYQLSDLARKLDMQVQSALSPRTNETLWAKQHDAVLTAIRAHCSELKTKAKDLLKDLDSRLKAPS